MRIALLLMLTLSTGCGGGGDSTGPIVLCTRNVTIGVASVSPPHFTWQPNCLASELVVLGAPTNQGALAFWWIRSDDGFPSGVTYGEAPEGAQVYTGPTSAPFPAGSTVNLYDANGDRIGSAPLPTS